MGPGAQQLESIGSACDAGYVHRPGGRRYSFQVGRGDWSGWCRGVGVSGECIVYRVLLNSLGARHLPRQQFCVIEAR
ncbi:hypothetical protein JB92DRAFT_3000548 [Gautieria morchelliformis]|nr:hypothetical protein JB92DRAFT_3000548 [Gautieria morchelliformis]